MNSLSSGKISYPDKDLAPYIPERLYPHSGSDTKTKPNITVEI